MPLLEPVLYLSAFLAGVLMFLAPCTLPLVPAYIGFISGVTEGERKGIVSKRNARKRILKNSLFFVMGFSLVFMITGILATLLGGYVAHFIGDTLQIIGAVLIICFGLFMIGGLRSTLLQKERRIQLPSWITVGTPVSSTLLGSAFAVGWSPCIGPIYGTILIYASTTSTLLIGVSLLLVFSIGFSVPFLLTALLMSHATLAIERIAPYLRVLSIIGGVFMVLVGLYMLFGHTVLTNWFFNLFTYFDVSDKLLPYL